MASRNGRRRSSGGSGSSRSRSKQQFDDYSIVDPKDIPEGSDVLVDVPVVKVDVIDLEVTDLHAQVAVLAEVRDILQLSVGADARLGKVELKIEGVEAQALLKARLGNVTAILERVLTTLDRNPEVLQSVGQAVEQVGGGAQQTLEGAGQAVEDVGGGAKGAVKDVGKGAGQAAGEVGEGAGKGLGEVGKGAREGVADIGQGAGQGVAGVGQGAGQGVAGVGQGVQQATGKLAGGGRQ